MELAEAKKIFKKNFIGPDELKSIKNKLNIPDPYSFGSIPKLPDIEMSNEITNSHILILGLSKNIKGEPITIDKMREFFGVDPEKGEPCFYNQDWYLKEKFSSKNLLEFKWCLIKKNIIEATRGKNPEEMDEFLKDKRFFPSAVLATFTFFAYYFLNNDILWKNDFIWCSDADHNGDRIYVGRYIDPNKINKNGFNIHRHLSIRECYGLASEIKI
jgi:hypothetical protein